jgi:murein DD-endopeptidase MepM/ murein hydrolase activator NlpD
LPPYESYIRSLENADLASTTLGREWIRAGELALTDSVTINLPFTESGAFEAHDPSARSYRFTGREGQVLQVNGQFLSEGYVFSNLFYLDSDGWENLLDSDSTLAFRHEFEQTGTYLLRIQPELLTNVYYSLNVSISPALENPVSGALNRDIGSIYGDPRDGGSRSHEGVDIFAPRGTPVIAPTDGSIRRVGTGNLGGKVIWMRDPQRNQSYYFAHLDSQLVSDGQRVSKGDTLGLVGNTGNARTTPPHLHFGIYARGSKDPIDYIFKPDNAAPALLADSSFSIAQQRVIPENVNFRSGPSTNHAIIRKLLKNDVVKVLATSGDWNRIRLPNMQEGYISSSLIQPLDDPISSVVIDSTLLVYHSPKPQAIPISEISTGMQADVLGSFNNYLYIRLNKSIRGWIKLPG